MSFYSQNNFEFWTFWTIRFPSGSVCSGSSHGNSGANLVIEKLHTVSAKMPPWNLPNFKTCPSLASSATCRPKLAGLFALPSWDFWVKAEMWYQSYDTDQQKQQNPQDKSVKKSVKWRRRDVGIRVSFVTFSKGINLIWLSCDFKTFQKRWIYTNITQSYGRKKILLKIAPY